MVRWGLGAIVFALLCSPSFAEDNFSEFEKLSKSKNPYDIVKAIKLIENSNSQKSAQLITGLLENEHERVKYEAQKALSRITDENAIEWLISELTKSPNDNVRAGIAGALGEIKSAKSADALVKALKDKSAIVRAETVSSIGLIGDTGYFAKLAGAFNGDSAWQVKANTLEALVKLDALRSREFVKKAFEDKNYQVRMEALFNITALDKEDAVAIIQKGLGDSDWRVRVSAAEATVSVKDKRCIEYLIDRLTKEIGRPRVDVLFALKALTGKEFGLDVKEWKSWWLNVKDSFDFANLIDDKGNNSRRTAAVEFYTVPIFSQRLSFILDLSGSMRDEYTKGQSEFTKLDFAKKELEKTINGFDVATSFNIILLGCYTDGTYYKKSKIWKQTLTQATSHSKSDAVIFIGKQQAKGWTNIYDALVYAFEDESVDTVFLLSDGGASRGEFTEADEILNHINRLNKFRKIMINTIHIEADNIKEHTKSRHTKLMRGLAEVTKGTYISNKDLENAKQHK